MNANTVKSKTGWTNSSRQRGSTLVELLLVLTILAILAALVLPNIARRGDQAREAAAKADIASLTTAIDMFEVDNGGYPRGDKGLESLMIKPREAQNTWRGPYLKKNKVPLDPWKRPYVYENPGKHNPSSYDLYSRGKDGDAVHNAIGNWLTD
jgi:general secretion pathway protein G